MNNEEHLKLAVDKIIGNGDIGEIKNLFSPDYVAHAGEKKYKGHEFIKKYSKQLSSAIPDIKILNIEILNKSGNVITWQRVFKGTHKKNLRGIPPSGKKIKWIEMVVSRFEKNKIVEEWVVSELAAQLALKKPKR